MNKSRTFLFNFNREFSGDVKNGRKRQTIRSTRADGRVPQPGDTVKLFTGLRTRGARLLKVAPVQEVFAIRMNLLHPPEIVLGAEKLSRQDAIRLAHRDGFEDLEAMVRWFRGVYGTDFDGFCVRW